ncbi:MAG: sigma-54 dependent transcriptional regulator [Desulfovibrionaceae bacterium]|nr:sigma-54 dependent transcriptional regulator [Desulfovibrionaceae bacterium]
MDSNPEQGPKPNHLAPEEHKRIRLELDYLRDRFWKKDFRDVVRTNCQAMREVFAKIRRVAPTKTTVLLTGETGVGKGTLAKLIHLHSNRASMPFISVNCGAIPENLVESELFGHEKGSFTGAVRQKLGKFEIARGGSLFLDEIGALSLSTQVKLLGVLQEWVFQRVGGDRDIEADVRVIAASNEDLKQACLDGAFRNDLFYRLNVFPIDIPPLRERVEDLPILIEVILNRLQLAGAPEVDGVAPEVVEAFKAYAWPGNVRELENLLERALILEPGDVLTPEAFPAEIFGDRPTLKDYSPDAGLTLEEARRLCVQDLERVYLRQLLDRNKGRIDKTALEAGISTRQLHKLMKKYGLHKEDYKRPETAGS